jgi:hypothetical protein
VSLEVKGTNIDRPPNVINILILNAPYASLKKEANEGIETSPNFCAPPSCLTYSYAGSHVLHCGITLVYPQAFPLVPILTTAAYRRHFLLPILTAAADTAVYLSLRRQPCFALWNHVRLPSGTPTCTNSYTTAAYRRHFLLPILTAAADSAFYLSLRWQPCFAL